MFFPLTRKGKRKAMQWRAAGGNGMEEVFSMYATSDGEMNAGSSELDHDHDDFEEDEEVEEVESLDVVTSRAMQKVWLKR